MKSFVLLTNVVSPHQMPLAKEIARLVDEENFRYVYADKSDEDHKELKWVGEAPQWCIHTSGKSAEEWLENTDVLLSGLREFDLFERRAKRGLKNLYMTERWFKPPIGMLRLLHPRYFCYARRLCRMMENGVVIGLPIGIHAAKDMARLCGLMHGDLRCLFCAPELEFERKPGGRIFSHVEHVDHKVEEKKYCLDKMRMWGYFVEKSELRHADPHAQTPSLPHSPTPTLSPSPTPRVLWVGRLLKLKRVDTIIRAVGELSTCSTCSTRLNISLDIYGTGPEEKRLKKMAAKYGDAIKFHPPVPIGEVRKLMREHDVYVLSSNGYEGWGAVVSEALEEGMKVVGTFEAGASATMLPKECLFRAGDWRLLSHLLLNGAHQSDIGNWTVRTAAETLIGR